MPTYEYKCPAGHGFEKFYPTMKDNRRVKCPTCGKPATRQISGGAGLVFKGSGFYINDYKRAGEKKDQEKKDQKEESQSPAESKPSTETKAAPESNSAKKKHSGDK
jgi:putative FmdB family regulatory protein